MKKSIILAVMLILFASISFAQKNVEVNSKGDFRLESDKIPLEWTPAGFTSDPRADNFVSFFKEAKNHPDSQVVVFKKAHNVKYSARLYKTIDYSVGVIVYNSKKNNIEYEDYITVPEKKIAYELITWLLAIVIMMISCYTFAYKKYFISAILTIFSFMLVFMTIIYFSIKTPAPFFVFTTELFALITFAFSCGVAFEENMKPGGKHKYTVARIISAIIFIVFAACSFVQFLA